MLPFPPPLLPEPITVPGNVADGDYKTRVRFVRFVGFVHLVSIAAFASLVAVFLRPDVMPALSAYGPERLVPIAALSLGALAVGRKFRLVWQLAALGVFFVTGAATLSFWLAAWHDTFPEFMETLGVAFGTGWVALLLYSLFCGRDYSFVGEFMLSFFAVAAFGVGYGIHVGLSLADIITIMVATVGALLYWTYDLAMVLRRRTAGEPAAAIIDLYRDLLNFVGFPVRILRMPRKRGRTTA